MTRSQFSAAYPAISHFIDTHLYEEADSHNLIELLHRTMKHGHPENASKLVSEFKRLSKDASFLNSEIAEIFNAYIPADYHVFSEDNASAVLKTISEYIDYLYNEEGLRGSKKWLT